MAVSIKDVAKRAGVASGTVSRAFNHYTDILPETKERIFAAARELGYTPNVSARSLSAKRPPNICLIAANMMAGDDRDSMLYLLLKGVLTYTIGHQLELTLYSLDAQEQSKISFTDFCNHHSISGAIISGVKTDDPYFTELVHSGIPVVGIDLPIEGEKTGWVSVDNRAAAADAVAMLHGRGFSRLLIVAGQRNAAVNEERMSGVRMAYRAAGMELNEEKDCLFADFREEEAFRRMEEWLARHPAPDAVFCFSDLMALGVMKALKKRGLRIPEDVSVMGFDGMPFTTLTDPPLATVRQDMRLMGQEAAAFLHGLMENACVPGHRTLPHQIVVRGSIRP
ncbi:MAG: LacI family DNA-binding transcriptional regulator [Clostridia bacterium]|nr:LacI family DNA-binding transcriptional regulator [Clostridia bacterium]